MFVYSFKASTLKFAGIAALSLVLLIVLIAVIPSVGSGSADNSEGVKAAAASINYDKIKTNEDRIAFLAQFGWEVEPEPAEEATVTIPSEFDRVFASYNELQKRQGLDLSRYKRKELTRYTYIVKNYPNYDGVVYANLLIYRNRVVGGDICSADVNGFLHGFRKEG
ncbi:MAG TPA: DUF4830 domain-containing protein [Bacillota bacterium]|nr:DUF4830 domain-containing protein [Clostridiales bacterium]HPT85118.1 DUF4830 domain-containing protein [Bacillota bacterium]